MTGRHGGNSRARLGDTLSQISWGKIKVVPLDLVVTIAVPDFRSVLKIGIRKML